MIVPSLYDTPSTMTNDPNLRETLKDRGVELHDMAVSVPGGQSCWEIHQGVWWGARSAANG